MFKDLLISKDDILIKKIYQEDRGYNHADKYFYVSKEDGLWHWSLTASVKKEFAIGNLSVFKKQQYLDKNGFTSWTAARDAALLFLKPYFPNISSEMIVRNKLKTYRISSVKHQNIKNCGRIKGKGGRWTTSVYFNNQNLYKTKKEVVDQLYKKVNNSLPLFYQTDINTYQKLRKNILAGQEASLDFQTWWMLFVKPEIDLAKIF